ncbi:MAG TPA: AAA family ATPase [Egibacteraceae bacterium]|nr:AAA family ATPase [Egibacteraceae bacterium]
MALLERDGELAALRDAAAAAREGRGSVVLLAGDAGIGKSALVQAWAGDPGADVRMLVGWCDDFLTRRPLGPLHDVARGMGAPLADALAAGDTGGVLDALLAELAYPLQATVLLLEDVHWADDATLDAVRYIGRRIHDLPAVLALTYRDDEVGPGHPLTGVLGAMPAGIVHRIGPRRLSRAAVAQLTFGSGLDPDEVVRVTDGNPFFVTELAAAGPAADASHGDAAPASVSDAVLGRLRKLPQPAQRAVEALSVVPGLVAGDLVAALVDDVADLADAERGGVLAMEGADVRFRHELARRAVLAALPSSIQLRHQRTVLDRLLKEVSEVPERLVLQDLASPRPVTAPPQPRALADHDAARLLHHAVKAGRGDVIARHGPSAAHEAFLTGAYRQAVEHQDQVLPHADAVAPHDLAVLLLERAWSLHNLHRFEDAVGASERSARIYAELGDSEARCRVLLTHARMLYMARRVDDAFAALDEAAGLVPVRDEVEAELRSNRLSLLHLADQHDRVLAEAEAAIAAAKAAGRSDLIAHNESYAGGSAAFLGDIDAGIAQARRGLHIASGNGWLEPTARTYTNLIDLLVVARRWEEAQQLIDEALSFFDDQDFRAHRHNALGQRARVALRRGDWSTARPLTGELSDSAADGMLAMFALELDASLAVRTGVGDAEAALARAWEVAQASRAQQHIVPVACAAIEWAWTADRPDAAEPYIRAALAAAGSTIWLGPLRWRLPLLGLPADPGGVLVEPERTSLSGDWRTAARGWDALGMPFEHAIELLRSGEQAPALEALQIFERLGAGPAARTARMALRDLGLRTIPRGPMSATRANPLGLTARQAEVLELLADGLTNAEIAEHLVVSVRTVDHHVSTVLQKLGVSSRKQAAERAAAFGAG